jgi:hypothetical protein
MIERLRVPVSVVMAYDHRQRRISITQVTYDGRTYRIKRITYRHTHRDGRTLKHVFAAMGETAYFKLVLNTDSLAWTLEEVHDHDTDSIALQPKAGDDDAY